MKSNINRRTFLRRSFAASVGGTAIQRLSFASDGAAASGRDLLVTVFLRGGCDGLGVLAPVDDPQYIASRNGELRLADKGPHAGLQVNQAYAGHDWRLHPAAAPLHELYAQGEAAFIHACGLKNATRSHFDAQDMMERGISDQKNLGTATGWLTRLLDSLPDAGLLPGLSAAGTLPVSFLGSSRAAAIASLQDFNYYGSERQMKVLRTMHAHGGALAGNGERLLQVMEDITKRLSKKADGGVADYVPAKGAVYPEHDFSNALKTIAQLAKMEVGLQIAAVDYGDWDTHTGQAYRMDELVQNLAKPLSAFYHDVGSLKQRVTIVVMSEFGRRVKANESGGTDHGHGNLMMVLGRGIKGGRCLGSWPGLLNDQLDEHTDLAITTDYRQVIAEVLQSRMRGADVSKVFPGYVMDKPLGVV